MLKLELTLEEMNIILGSLGKQPYEVVFKLVEKLYTTAKEQVEPSNDE